MSGEIKQLLLIPHIQVHNANALSSPFTIGFPAMTAWMGATHALQRKLNSAGFDQLKFKATAVISHQCDLQTHRGVGDYVHSIIGTGNPLDKTGSRSAFIEEAQAGLIHCRNPVFRLSLGLLEQRYCVVISFISKQTIGIVVFEM